MALNGIFAPGDHVITTDLEHNSVLRPLYRLEKQGIISLSFMAAGYGIACSSMFQALGHGMMSLYMSVVRQLVVLLPVAFILSKIGGLGYVWYAFPIAEVSSLVLATVFLTKVYKKKIMPLKDHAEA